MKFHLSIPELFVHHLVQMCQAHFDDALRTLVGADLVCFSRVRVILQSLPSKQVRNIEKKSIINSSNQKRSSIRAGKETPDLKPLFTNSQGDVPFVTSLTYTCDPNHMCIRFSGQEIASEISHEVR
ncbi:MAG: hypothetical protein HYX80_04700 [Chloroflexi bacterium]|nr:hypothetical protein [Chloroflexota bacterium]